MLKKKVLQHSALVMLMQQLSVLELAAMVQPLARSIQQEERPTLGLRMNQSHHIGQLWPFLQASA
ncbi:hypothetical protein P245_24755 [Comamonas thiooxydans]|uniref:Uncharacterized protein n=1 Tax=Comamonas thiooxydans TaxID=363952 RepID=A0A0E3BVK6_9BURK|nr:hypothetical protein P245_24755 [Comamonas thiooxydans]